MTRPAEYQLAWATVCTLTGLILALIGSTGGALLGAGIALFVAGVGSLAIRVVEESRHR